MPTDFPRYKTNSGSYLGKMMLGEEKLSELHCLGVRLGEI